MTATNHVLTGTVVALAVRQPVLAIPLAFLSHFAIDVIPHFEARNLSSKIARLFIFSDVFIGGAIAILMTVLLQDYRSSWVIFICAFIALSPDLIWAWRYYRLKDLDKTFAGPMSWVSRLHLKIQLSETLQGFFVEIAWFALMIFLIIKLTD
jgi:hypothetical protein